MNKQNKEIGNTDSETEKLNWKDMNEINPEFREEVMEKDTGNGVSVINTDVLNDLRAELDLYRERESVSADAAIDLTVDEVNNLGHEIVRVITMVEIINDVIDFYPSQEEAQDVTFYYDRVQRSLNNVFRMNQDVITRLDNVGSLLYAATDDD